MVMDTRRGDVFHVIVPCVGLHPRHPLGRIFAHAVGMADVEVEAEGRMVHPLGELQVLPERLDEEARFRLHEQRHAHLGRHFEHRHDLVVEDVGRLLAGLPRLDFAAGLRRDLLCPKVGSEPQRPLRVFAADRPVVRVGIGPAGMPVGLPRVGDRIHHECIDIGDDEAAVTQRPPDRLLLHLEEPRRPSMRHVGQQLDT